MSMGVFVDSAAVAPAIRQVGLKQLLEARLAAGLNLNLYTDRSEIAGLTVAFSPEGVNVALAIGLSNQNGDRQHRD